MRTSGRFAASDREPGPCYPRRREAARALKETVAAPPGEGVLPHQVQEPGDGAAQQPEPERLLGHLSLSWHQRYSDTYCTAQTTANPRSPPCAASIRR